MKKQYYLLHLQYLGYRYHGWLKQPGLKTIESMLEKTALAVFGHTDFTIVGASRTDARVSAHHAAFELIIPEALPVEMVVNDFNKNLPNDIRIVKGEVVDEKFAIIAGPRIKEYLYLFASGEKTHPFCASLVYTFPDTLDIELMKQGAVLFEGTHNFRRYCATPKPGTIFTREIVKSRIEENTLFTANFFPKKTYAYHVHAQGFMRHQVRLMMGQLLSLGRGEINLEEIKSSLTGNDATPLKSIAPSSGLMLYDIRFGPSKGSSN